MSNPGPKDTVQRKPTDWKSKTMRSRIAKRYRSERNFRGIGLGAVLLSAGFLTFLLYSMLSGGLGGFQQTEVKLPIDFATSSLMIDPALLKADKDAALASADIEGITAQAADKA